MKMHIGVPVVSLPGKLHTMATGGARAARTSRSDPVKRSGQRLDSEERSSIGSSRHEDRPNNWVCVCFLLVFMVRGNIQNSCPSCLAISCIDCGPDRARQCECVVTMVLWSCHVGQDFWILPRTNDPHCNARVEKLLAISGCLMEISQSPVLVFDSIFSCDSGVDKPVKFPLSVVCRNFPTGNRRQRMILAKG